MGDDDTDGHIHAEIFTKAHVKKKKKASVVYSKFFFSLVLPPCKINVII